MSLKEANGLVKKYVRLCNKLKKTNDKKTLLQFKEHEQLCVQKFKYLVLMKTGKYKNFNNYEDLNQEGFEALLIGMNSYDPNKGNIFWWLHKYIDTRIARSANLHTTIRFPLKYAKQVAPRREPVLPLLIDNLAGPHDIVEQEELFKKVKKSLVYLPDNQRQIIKMLFGIDEMPQSVTKVCKQLHMSRPTCLKILNQVLNTLKRDLQI